MKSGISEELKKLLADAVTKREARNAASDISCTARRNAENAEQNYAVAVRRLVDAARAGQSPGSEGCPPERVIIVDGIAHIIPMLDADPKKFKTLKAES